MVMTVRLSVAVISSAMRRRARLASLALFVAAAELGDTARRGGLGEMLGQQVVARVALG